MNKIQNLDCLTGQASCITIVIHTHPDGDAIGSGIALKHYLTELRSKDTVLIAPDVIPASLAFIASGEDPESVQVFGKDNPAAEERIRLSDLIFCLDFNSLSRTGEMEGPLRASSARKILFDHHLNPETDTFDLVFSKTDISSASELLYWTLKEMPEIEGISANLPKASAAALLTGMTTDTNNFGNSVFPSTLKMASELIGCGVDRDRILCSLYNNYRENRVRLMGFMLSEKMKITSNGLAYMILDKETQNEYGMEEGETEGFVNIPLSIAEVRMSLFLTEEGDRFRVSVRSKQGTSANSFASRFFNGGGHELAAGGKLTFKKDIPTPDDAEAYILNVSDLFFK